MKRGGFVLVLWMMFVVVSVGKEIPNNIEETAVKVTGSGSGSGSGASSYSGWSWKEELRKVVNRACTYLFPPKIDFRPGKDDDDDDDAQVNMKEALTKSFHHTKQMVEDSANLAAQTLQQPKPHSEL